MNKDYKFELTAQDKQSHLWSKIQKHFAHILERERKINDKRASQDDTNFTRGKISLVNELIRLNEVDGQEE